MRLGRIPRPLRARSPWLPDMSRASLGAEVGGVLAGLAGCLGFLWLTAG